LSFISTPKSANNQSRQDNEKQGFENLVNDFVRAIVTLAALYLRLIDGFKVLA